MFEIRHRNAPGNIQDLFQDISDIHSYNTRSSVSNNFYTQSSRLSIQVNSFSRIGRKIWNEMPMSLRKLPKAVFKRKRKQILFEILASEDCYIDLPVIIQKVKLNLFSSQYVSLIFNNIIFVYLQSLVLTVVNYHLQFCQFISGLSRQFFFVIIVVSINLPQSIVNQ